MKRIITALIAIVLFCGSTLVAQPQYSYDPLSGYISNSIPFNNSSLNRRQNMYYPTDFNSPVAGLITKIYFKSNTAVSPSYLGFQVYIGTSTANGLVAGPFVTAGMVQSFNAATFTTTSVTGNNWIEITLDTPFLWDATSNLIIDVQHAGFSVGFTAQYINASGRTSLYGGAAATTASTQTRLAVFGYDMIPPGSLCTAPPPAGVALSDTSQVCTNDTVNLSSSLASVQGQSYQWQYSTDSINWSNLTNDTSVTAVATVPSSRWFRLEVSCNSFTSMSLPVKVEAQNPPMPAGTSNVVVVNAGGADVQFDGSASTDYTTLTWDFGDGSPTVNGVSPLHTYTANGTYTVTITGVGPCGTISSTIQVEIKTIGLEVQDIFSVLKIFPNPSVGDFNIDLVTKFMTPLSLRIVNLQGQILLDKDYGNIFGTFNTHIDLNKAANGIYLLQINTNQGVVTRRITLSK